MTKWFSVLAFSLLLLAGNAMAGNILVNPGFEDGVLTPWFNSNDFCGGCVWDVTSSDAHSGTFSAFVIGDRLLEQDFAAVLTSDITEASLWLKMPDTGIAAIYFLYSDFSTEQNIVNVGSTWTLFDVTSFLDPGKSLIGFGVYGCTGCFGASMTLADDFVINAGIPEPGTLVLLGTGMLGVATFVRRRF